MANEHFVFVHGTWAHGMWRSVFWRLLPDDYRRRKVDWPLLQSKLEAEGGTVHNTFAWSGQNNHIARKKASRALQDYLRELIAQGIRPYLLSHSHGGNVSLYTLNDPAIQKNIKGMIFLATPFLHFQRQNLDLVIFRALPLVVMFVALGVFLVIAVFLTGDQIPTILMLVIIFACFGLALAVGWLIKAVVAKWNLPGRADSQCEEFQPPAPAKDRGMDVLVVRSVGDEATTALVGGQLLELLLSMIWKALVTVVADWPNKLLSNRKLAVIIFVPIFVVAWLASEYLEPIKDEPLVGYLIMAVIAVIVVAAAIQVLLAAAIAIFNVIRFGWGNVAIKAFVRVSTESTPLGRWPVELFRSSGQGLAHSEAYQNKEIVDKIVRWVEDRRGKG